MIAKIGECGWVGEAIDAPPFVVWRAAMRWSRLVNEELQPMGLTYTQFLVLAATAAATDDAKDAVHQQAIANRAGVDKVTTSRLMRQLERRGLVDRGGDGHDPKRWRILLTGAGARLLNEARAPMNAARKRFRSDAAELVAATEQLVPGKRRT